MLPQHRLKSLLMQSDSPQGIKIKSGAAVTLSDNSTHALHVKRVKVLHITRNLPPLVGGMERLNWHMAAELSKTHDVTVIGPTGSAAIAPFGIKVHEAPLQPLWRFLLAALRIAHREAKQWHPDIILAGSGLTAPIARYAARLAGAQTVIYTHGLDITVKHPIYRLFWLPAIRRADRVIANSQPTRKLCLEIGVNSNRLGVVYPGVDLPSEIHAQQKNGSEPLSPLDRSSLRNRYNLGNRPVLLSVGRLSARKGLREFVEHALPEIVAAHPDTILLVVGDAPKDALLAQSQTQDSIRASAKNAGVEENIRFLGKISDEELYGVYRSSDLHVFPVRTLTNDPEGFGMVAIEAAICGLPTVAFATGGVVDAVSEGKSGYLVKPNDYLAFANTVIEALKTSQTMQQSCIQFAQQFAWPNFGAGILAQFSQITARAATNKTVDK